MIMVIRSPSLERAGKDIPNDELDSHLDDDVLQAIVKRFYHLFCLFNGTFAQVVAREGINALKARLYLLISYYLNTLEFDKLPYFVDVQGFRFLPVDRSSFLTIQFLLASISAQFPNIKTGAVMYASKLIWSGFAQEDMYRLYGIEQDPKQWLYAYINANASYQPPAPDADQDVLGKRLKKKKVEPPPPSADDDDQQQHHHHQGDGGDDALHPKEPEPLSSVNIFQRYAIPVPASSASTGLSSSSATSSSTSASTLTSTSTSTTTTSAAGADVPIGYRTGPLRPGSNLTTTSSVSTSTIAPEASPSSPTASSSSSSSSDASSSSSSLTSSTSTTASSASAATISPFMYTPRVFAAPIRMGLSSGRTLGPQASFEEASAAAKANGLTLDVSQTRSPTAASASARAPVFGAGDVDANEDVYLIVYRCNQVTLMLLASEPTSKAQYTSAGLVAPASISAGASKRSSSTPSKPSFVLSPTSPAPPSGSTGFPIAFYAELEQYMQSNLVKLADMLGEQVARASGQDDFRFLYFNNMNLAMKTTLSGQQVPLTVATVRTIRQIHTDFAAAAASTMNTKRLFSSNVNTASVPATSTAAESKEKAENASEEKGEGKSTSVPSSSSTATASSALANNVGDMDLAAILERANAGPKLSQSPPLEVCVRTRSNGWVVGRRATESNREFFVLLDDKITSLVDVQNEVDKLARSYFYNIFIY